MKTATERMESEKSTDLLSLLKSELQNIRTEIGSAVVNQRETNAETRFCKWDGQSDDGRKRRASLGKDARPFEGASDSRIRLADKVVNERVQEYLAAALRATPRAVGTGGEDEMAAAKVSNLMKWLIRNQWGSKYRQEIELLAQWMEGDSPALAVLAVWWYEETRLGLKTITREQMMEMLGGLGDHGTEGEEDNGTMGQGDHGEGEGEDHGTIGPLDQGADPEMVNQMIDLLMNPLREAELAGMLGMMEPGIPAGRLTTMARELQTNGETQFPAPYVCGRIPRPEALRVWEDIFFRANVTDLQRAPLIVVRRWLTAAEVMEYAARDGWSRQFKDQVLGHEGQSCLDQMSELETNEGLDLGLEPHRGLFEVLWAYRRAANRQGAIGIYETIFSGLCDCTAKAEELLDYQHGEFPFIACPRERLTRRLTDTRSMSELVMTQQQSLKLVNDSLEDHVQVMTNPPVKVPSGTSKYAVTLAPFGQIEDDNPRKPIEFLQRPPYPEAADKHWDRIQADVDDYTARENAGIPPNRASLARQIRSDKFLAYLADGLMMGFQLIQQFWSDDDFERVARIRGMPKGVKEIRGRFDLAFSFDVRDMDQEYLLKKAETLLKYVRPLDTRAQLPYDRFLKQIVEAIDPNWGDMAQDAEEADARIIKDETDNYVKIQNGVEPEMPEMVENPQLRLERIKQLHIPRVQNPQAFAPESPASQALLENRVKYLQQQATQMDNAVIGRIGAAPTDLGTV